MNLRFAFARLFERLGFIERRFRVKHLAEVPDQPRPFEVYAIGDQHVWQAALLCPCGCGHLIQLSLLAFDSPHWDLKIAPGRRATISPSVWRSLGCQAHFFVRDGKIVWCDSGQ